MDDISLPAISNSPAPLMRIFTFGGVTIEVLVSSPFDAQPCYEPLSHDVWQSRGPALTMLKFLLSRPALSARQALQEEIIDAIWTETEQLKMGDVEKAFRAAVGVLRKVLTPKEGTESLLLVVPGTTGESTRYKLADAQRLWIDADTFEELVAQAIRQKELDVALTLGQQAIALVRGDFLENNRYQDWSQARRQTLTAEYRRLVLYLSESYIRSGQFPIADELLHTFLAHYPLDQDALYLLMSVLEQQEQYHAAWLFYKRAREQKTQQQDVQLSPRLHAIAKRIRGHLSTSQPLRARPRLDLGEAPHQETLYGRANELSTLQTWITRQQAQLISIVGMAGVGKTSLTVTLLEQIQTMFTFVLWRSLQNAPPLQTLLHQCLTFFSDEADAVMPTDESEGIQRFLALLQQHRCLLVLDNIESILQNGHMAGEYREDYEGYGRLFQLVGEMRHQSCLILTSRELPGNVAVLEEKYSSVLSYPLEGLQQEDGEHILEEKEIKGTEQALQTLIDLYAGNPLALKLAGQCIAELFAGDIAAFLQEGEIIFGDIRDVLDQHFERLSRLEQEVIYKIAKQSDGLQISALQETYADKYQKRDMQEVIQSLVRRSLIKVQNTKLVVPKLLQISITEHFKREVTEKVFSPIPTFPNSFSQTSLDLTPYEKKISAALQHHRTKNAQYLLQDINDDIHQLEHLETLTNGTMLSAIKVLIISNTLLASKIVKDQKHYALAYAYANYAVRVAKSLGNDTLLATTYYARGCTKLESALFGIIEQGRFQIDQKGVHRAIIDLQEVLHIAHSLPGHIHPQLCGYTQLQLSRAQSVLTSIFSEEGLSNPLLLADQAYDMVGREPLDSPHQYILATGTLSGLRVESYQLVKAGIFNLTGLADKAFIELSQIRQEATHSYEQTGTRDQAWYTLTIAEALMGLEEYAEAVNKTREALVTCYQINSIQNAAVIVDLYSRMKTSSYGQSSAVKELGDMLHLWDNHEIRGREMVQ